MAIVLEANRLWGTLSDPNRNDDGEVSRLPSPGTNATQDNKPQNRRLPA
jgi:hypothetical protein